MTAGLGQVPQPVAARQPAELVERPADPGRVAEALDHGHGGAGAGRLQRHQPAVLVVHRAQHQGQVAAVVAPLRAEHGNGAALGRLGRVVAGTQVGQRVGIDARQGGQVQLQALALVQVEDSQSVRGRLRPADPAAHVDDFGVTRFGDVVGHLAAAGCRTVLGRLAGDQQPAGIGRGQGRQGPLVLAQVPGRRSLAGIGTAQFKRTFAFAGAFLAGALQGVEQAQLGLHQGVLVIQGVRLVLPAQVGQRADQPAGRIDQQPALATGHQQPAIGGEGRLADGFGAGSELAQPTRFQVTQEQVAVTDKCGPPPGGLVDRRGAVDRRPVGIGHWLVLATGQVDGAQLPQRTAGLLDLVIGLAAIQRPPGILDRRPDPVRVGHDLFQRRGRQCRQAPEQQQHGQGAESHRIVSQRSKGR